MGISVVYEPIPSYAELPVRAGLPAGSAWEVFGANDSLGTVNHLGSREVLNAASHVSSGEVFALNWDVSLPDPPLFGRRALQHTTVHAENATDDFFDSFYPQASTQWDALCHIGHPQHGLYNGRSIGAVDGGPNSPNGIEHWARRGIVGRYVLADIESWRASVGRPLEQGSGESVTTQEVADCLEASGTRPQEGDILLLRFGWIRWYEQLSSTQRRDLAVGSDFVASGLSRDESSAAYLWDGRFAAVVCDSPGLETNPIDLQSVAGFLHYRLIPLLGFAVGELFFLDDLANACHRDRRYEGMFCASPVNYVGGSGSPGNALAIR
jgi:hypothetical protein